MSFLNPVDICNRGLQHIGIQRINDFNDDSRQAAECSFVYDKVRRAELRRNTWRFAIRRAALRAVQTGTMLLSPELWSASTTYPIGAIVSDANGYPWQSQAQDNLNNAPGNSYAWEAYCGPLTVSPYDTTGETGYYAGELVYETPGDGTYKVYVSLINDNSADPSVASVWSSSITYYKDQVVEVSSTFYVSLIDFNLNQNPASAPALWNASTAYVIGNSVGASDGFIYTATANNTGKDPTATVGYWTNTGVLNPWTTVDNFGTAGVGWQQINAVLADLEIVYPIGSGPSEQSFTRNVFRLPANYLKVAPENPKQGSVSFLGAPTGLMYRDYNYEGNYLVSMDPGPIVLRFVADLVNVVSFDDMFCEGLAARIGMEVCETLTQNTQKAAKATSEYGRVMGEARLVNGIETGPTEPPEDDWITTRL